MPDPYLAAWEYRRQGWPATTDVAWFPQPATSGEMWDDLRLHLPFGMVGIHTSSLLGTEELGWHEARHGTLPRTWQTGVPGSNVGTLLYRVPFSWQWRHLSSEHLQIKTSGIPVWPSRYDFEGLTSLSWRWQDEAGDLHPGPPRPEEFAELPADWILALRAEGMPRPMIESADTLVRRFAHSTLVRSHNPAHRITTDYLFGLFEQWTALSDPADTILVTKTQFGRILSRLGWDRWAGRIPSEGFRRGFEGIRLPRPRHGGSL